MALPAFHPEDEEDVAGAAPGVAPVALAPSLPPAGFPAMPGMPPGAPPTPGAPPPADQLPPDPNANLPPDALMQPGPGLQPPAPPLGAPGGPPVPLTPDGKIDIPAAEKGALAEQGQLTAQGEDAERRKGAAEAKVAEAESAGADKQADLAQQTADEQQKIVATANQRTQQWLDQAQQDAQKYRGMGLHDYWADKSTGDKVLAGLSMLFGAAGKTQGGPENNPGMGMIERAVERDFRKQQADIEKARSNVAMDKEQFDLGMTAKQQALADSQLKKANAYDAAAAQLVSYKLKQGVPLAQAQTDANVVALRQNGLKARQELLQAVHAQNVADAHLQIEQERADAYRAKMARGHGAGGGGGAGRADAASQLAGMIEQGKDGRPLTQQEMIDAANQLHIPLFGKPSQTTLDSIKKSVAFNKDAARKDQKAGLGDERQLSKEATEWAKQNGLADINKKQRELSSVLDEVKNAPHNPLQQALAIEKAVSSARGGAASRQALDLALHHLGGRWDSIEAFIQAGKTGEVGEKQMENFIGFMNNQLGTAQKEGKDKYDAFNAYIDSQPPEKRAELEAQRGKLFSGFAGFGGQAKASGGGAAGAARPAMAPSEKAAKAKAILNDPAKRALYDDKQLARLIQISQGG